MLVLTSCTGIITHTSGTAPQPGCVPLTCGSCPPSENHIPSHFVVEGIAAHRKPPEVKIWRLSSQSRVGTVPPSTSTPHWPACWARADRAPGCTDVRALSERPVGCLWDDETLSS